MCSRFRNRGALLCIAVCVLSLSHCGRPSGPMSLDEIRSAVARGDTQAADTGLEQLLARTPEDADARLLAARMAAARGSAERCREHLQRLPDRPPAEQAPLLTALAADLIPQGALTAAEAALTRAVAADPASLQAHADLAYILGVEGRCFEAAPHLLAAVRGGTYTPHHLVLLGASDPVIDDPALVERCLKAFPQDPLPRLGQARTNLRRERLAAARDTLQQIVAVSPDCGEAQGQLGRALFAMGDPDFPSWSARVPTAAEFHPEVWVARGLWLQQHDTSEAAARCFWEAVRRDSEHRLALAHLAQTLSALGRDRDAAAFRLRSERLRELAQVVDDLYEKPDASDLLRSAMRLTEELGRDWEAKGWAEMAARSGADWAAPAVQRISARIAPQMGRVAEAMLPAAAVDLSGYPLHDRTAAPSSAVAEETGAPPEIRFVDQATKAGLMMVYRSRGPQDAGEMRMYETTGGGVAVLDYDRDGRPDLYFTQGGSLVASDQPPEMTDRLFRLSDRSAFADVTAKAKVHEASYGQGASAGDVNNDGFPDLYVGNLGGNRLLVSNGDGTFDDVTAAAGLSGAHWTTSCLMADLNGDGNPDLYDVNYVTPEDAVRATCRHGEELRWCSPSSFTGDLDVLWLSDGAGGFRDVSKEAGIEVPNGKGLGIVAADLDRSGRLSLFVANDAVPNFFFQNATASSGDTPRFVEAAMETGLALDADGMPQACMGIASGDLNEDQLLDFYVTNFYDESNTAYLQQSGGLFSDDTRSTGLREPSLKMLGFGTQALDADLDGRLDLVVTNGHVLDLSASGTPFEMPSQLFWNRGRGRFLELSRSAGEDFARPVLGRGLARVDWNGDGADDFIVSHIHSPAALMTNANATGNGSVGFRFVSTGGARDAIGATIQLKVGGRVLTRQLTGGDGYQCANERQILVGLDKLDRAEQVTVRWMSGATQHLGEVRSGQTLLIVENQGAWPVPR